MFLLLVRLKKERDLIQSQMEKQLAEQLQEAESNYNLKLKEQKEEYESQLQKMQCDMVSGFLDNFSSL